MTDRKHTPGPWRVVRDRNGAATMILSSQKDEDGDELPVIDYEHGGYTYAYEANARLIAAAPDMYEALKEAREALATEIKFEISASVAESLEATIAQIDAALSKAEGSAALSQGQE